MLHTITPYGRRGGSSRVRVFDWLDHLELSAISHDYVSLSTNRPSTLVRHPWAVASAELSLRHLRTRLGGATVLLSKQASPLSRGGLEASLLGNAERGVYDFDDNLLDEGATGLVRRVFPKERTWTRAIQAADVVVAGNAYLADQATALVAAEKVFVIPSCVEPDEYVTKSDYDIHGAPRAVWLGSPTTEAQLLTIAEPLLRLNISHGLRLTLISAGSRPLSGLEGMTDRISWTPTAASCLAQADLGIMPLPNTPQARGKCAYKLLQYGAAGLPPWPVQSARMPWRSRKGLGSTRIRRMNGSNASGI